MDSLDVVRRSFNLMATDLFDASRGGEEIACTPPPSFWLKVQPVRLVLLFALLLILLCSSCTTETQGTEEAVTLRFDEAPAPTRLASVELDWGPFFLPTRLKQIGDYLFIADLKNPDAMVTIWDIDQQREVKRIIPKGEGPFELSAVSSIFLQKGGRVYFFDLQSQRMLEADLDSLVAYPHYQPKFRKRLASEDYEYASRIHSVNDSVLVAMTLPALQGRFSLLNNNLEYTGHYFGQFPFLERTGELSGMTDISFGAKVLGNLFVATMDVNQPLNKLVVTYNNVDMIDVYNLTDHTLELRVLGPDQNYPPKFRLTESGALPCRECHAGYKSPQSNNDYFVALRLNKRYADVDAYQSRHVYVFSWSGELIKSIELDFEIADFVIDPKRRKLFALAVDASQPLREYPWSMN